MAKAKGGKGAVPKPQAKTRPDRPKQESAWTRLPAVDAVLPVLGLLLLALGWRDLSRAGRSPECRMTWSQFR